MNSADKTRLAVQEQVERGMQILEKSSRSPGCSNLTPDEVLISAAVSYLLGRDWHRMTTKEHDLFAAAKEAGYVHAPNRS